MQTVWTQIRSDKTLGLIWVQTVWHSDDIPERIFQKNLILKKFSRQQKSMKINKINFANSLDPDQARQMSGLIWIQTVWHLWYSWKNFSKKLILKKFSRRQKSIKITQCYLCFSWLLTKSLSILICSFNIRILQPFLDSGSVFLWWTRNLPFLFWSSSSFSWWKKVNIYWMGPRLEFQNYMIYQDAFLCLEIALSWWTMHTLVRRHICGISSGSTLPMYLCIDFPARNFQELAFWSSVPNGVGNSSCLKHFDCCHPIWKMIYSCGDFVLNEGGDKWSESPQEQQIIVS